MIDHNLLIGKQFGNLKVIEIGPTNKHRKKLLKVICLKHPNITPYYVVKQSLVNGSTTGCKECWLERHSKHGKTGMWKTRSYKCWTSMISRLRGGNRKDAHIYEHLDMDPRYNPDICGSEVAFKNFYNDIGDIDDNLTVDRIDNSKGYWKSNIRLATMTDQLRNRSTNVVDADLVKQIRNDFNTGLYKNKDLSKKYNIRPQHMSRILNYKVWKDI
jgi:hypothetical protein